MERNGAARFLSLSLRGVGFGRPFFKCSAVLQSDSVYLPSIMSKCVTVFIRLLKEYLPEGIISPASPLNIERQVMDGPLCIFAETAKDVGLALRVRHE